MQCNSCGGWWHPHCLGKSGPVHRGPWHCAGCLVYHRAAGTRDITLDQPLLKYLACKESPKEVDERRRVG